MELAKSTWGMEQARSLLVGELVVNWLVNMPVVFWDPQPYDH